MEGDVSLYSNAPSSNHPHMSDVSFAQGPTSFPYKARSGSWGRCPPAVGVTSWGLSASFLPLFSLPRLVGLKKVTLFLAVQVLQLLF